MPKVPSKGQSIENAIEKLDYPASIKAAAKDIYVKNAKNESIAFCRKGAVVFFCIYQAHCVLNLPRNIKTMAGKVNLREKNCFAIIKSMAIRQLKSGTDFSFVNVSTADQFVRGYCKKITEVHESRIANIETFVQKLLELNPSLIKTNPKKMAAASIQLYLERFGITVHDEKFMTCLDVTNFSSVLADLREKYERCKDHLFVNPIQ